MDNQPQIDLNDLSAKLSENDKEELRGFLNQEATKSHLQNQTHKLTKMCWKSCMTGSVRGPALDRGEGTCLANCVERFLDVNFITIKHLENMKN